MSDFIANFFRIRIDTWSELKKFIACLMFGVFIVIFGYEVDIRVLQKKVVITRGSLQSKKQEIHSSELQKQDPKLLQAQYITKPDEYAPELEVVNILSGLEKAILEAQVEPYLFELQPARESEWFAVYPTKLELNGTYKNLFMFINKVLKQNYLVVIEELVLQKKLNLDNDSNTLNLQILLAVYKKKKAIPKSSINKLEPVNDLPIQTSDRDIFRSPNSGMNLYLWSSKELCFLGLLRQGEITFGIVADPMGGVHRITVGDKIGLGQSRITAIDERGIVTVDGADNVSVAK